MKKLLLSVVLIASAVTFTFAQTSKWSATVKGGGTYFRVTPAGDDFVNDASWGAGLQVERTFNPLFGMGLDVSYLNFNRSTVTGKTIDPTLFASVNLTNLLFPNRQSTFFSLYAKAGAGVGFYNNEIGNTKDNDFSPMFAGSIHPEFNLGKRVALGLEVSARYYVRENMGGMVSKDRFDDGMTAMATLRFNLGGNAHVRNMTMNEFYPAPAPVIKQVENSYDDSQVVNRLDNLDRQSQSIQDRLAKLENDVRDLQNKHKGSSVNVSFDNIEFDFDSANLTDPSLVVLNQIVSILKNNPTWATLKVNGYTDNIGSESYNQSLSESRVQSVKDYLVSQGIDATVVATEGFGESNPIADNSTREGRQKNRRVEFQIVK